MPKPDKPEPNRFLSVRVSNIEQGISSYEGHDFFPSKKVERPLGSSQSFNTHAFTKVVKYFLPVKT